MATPEFTLTLFRRDLTGYTAWARFRSGDPRDDEEDTAQAEFQLDPVKLSRAWSRADEYGAQLTAAVFAGEVGKLWAVARKAAQNQPALRVRLEIQETALDLHRLRWETLRDPDNPAQSLLTSQNFWFSRYLPAGREGLRRRSRVASPPRVLVVVAAPRDLAERGEVLGQKFEPKDVFDAADVEAVKGFIRPLTDPDQVTVLPDDKRRATLGNVIDLLRADAGFDVLYLVAHGGLDGSKPKLLLEDDAGNLKVTDAEALVGEVGEMRFPPRLVVLSSCRSAGEARPYRPAAANGELDAALGPQLGRAGVPAVVAMLGDVYRETAVEFVKAFFTRLAAADGQLDRAAAEARHDVHLPPGKDPRPDYWSPVVYTRLTSGQLWRAQRDRHRPDWFDGLLDQLRYGTCIPVLGSGVLDPVVGSSRALARRLIEPKKRTADESRVEVDSPDLLGHPMDLPGAAQYAATFQRRLLPARYPEAVAQQVRKVFPEFSGSPLLHKPDLAAELGPTAPPQKGIPPFSGLALEARRLLAMAADRVRSDAKAGKGPPEPHDVLARLGCPVYVSTNPDDLLGRALGAQGRQPVVQVSNWLDPPGKPPGSPEDGDDVPSPERPLVCHLFGHLSDPKSVVLSEDDYFKFLVGISNETAENRASSLVNRRRLGHVDARLGQSGLLFLGFRLDDWDFRAFLHFFLNREAAKTRGKVLDVAVQLDPEDGRYSDPDLVRRYLERLFAQTNIELYWGTTQEFLEELAEEWRE
jgi:hypothetical protein